MSRFDAPALLPLAESIADGAPVDWDAVEAGATSGDLVVIRQLRVLSNLATLHRSLPTPSSEAAGATPGRHALAAPAIGSWAHLALIERIGGGTFADVYRAWDPHLEREVALKLLRADERIDDLHASRIAREGRLLARVRHANVITVHGVDAHHERVGLWMELVRGVTLEQQIAERGPLSAREAAAVGVDLCRALAAVHAAGLIHRDVKAQNVMREDGGRIVLMDLGTGREIETAVPRTVPDLAGTPLYLAPEIFGGGAATEGTDLYSLGVLLYHLVTGSFPVRATSIEELEDGHRRRRGVRLRDARADLPTSFVRVVDRAISSDPGRRYTSAGAFEAALVETLDDSEGRAGVLFRRATRLLRSPRRIWPAVALAAGAVAVVALIAILWTPFGRAPAPIRSIAVLPLANLSGDAAQDYFADGMTELLIDDLARIRALRVISRTSAMQYKGSNKSLKEIARALNVDAVLEGSVQRVADRVRISADLVQVSSDRHVWVERYERDVRDMLALQSEVARAIAGAVQIQLTPQEQAGFALAASAPQVNLAAQDAYLQGRYYWNKRTSEGLQQALEYFREAARLDPAFAPAYAGQADSYNLLPGHMAPSVAYPQAKAAATRALALNPNLAEAHASLAFATFVFDRNWAETEKEFQRALELNPGYATAHQWYAEYLVVRGRLEEGFAQFEQASALDPLSPAILAGAGSTLAFAGRYDDAMTQLRASLDLDPNGPGAYYYLAVCYELKGMLAEAAVETRHGLDLAPRSEFLLSEQGRLAALSGRRADALKVAADLSGMSSGGSVPVTVAYVYAALGDKNRAFAALNRARIERSPSLLYLKIDPLLASLRDDARFSDLVRQVGISQ
jgi:TolB-like protein/tRNA A-37 threonylcarbamoyl transferase component Bud32/Tfp pilus assembly protein PilF